MIADVYPPTYAVHVYESNSLLLRFTCWKLGTSTPLDLSAATSIKLEWQVDRVAQAPIIADRAHSLADWAHGVVVVGIGPGDVTKNIASVQSCLTVLWSASSLTLGEGTIEVEDRLGYPIP